MDLHEDGGVMKLISMKLPKKSEKELKAEMVGGMPSTKDQPKYPYGLELSFNKDIIEKIAALKDIDADAEVEITARGFVKRVEASDVSKKEGGDSSRRSVDVQITDIGIEVVKKDRKAEGGAAPAKKAKKPEDMSPDEYSEFRKPEGKKVRR